MPANIRRRALPLLALTLLLALPLRLPAPMSPDQMGVDPEATPEEQAAQIEQWNQRNAQARAEVMQQRTEQVQAAAVARVTRTTTPPELAERIAAQRARRRSTAVPEAPVQGQWISYVLGLSMIGMLVCGVLLLKRQQRRTA